jgi:hypothetical protein
MLFKMENSKEKLIIGCFSRTAAPYLEWSLAHTAVSYSSLHRLSSWQLWSMKSMFLFNTMEQLRHMDH